MVIMSGCALGRVPRSRRTDGALDTELSIIRLWVTMTNIFANRIGRTGSLRRLLVL